MHLSTYINCTSPERAQSIAQGATLGKGECSLFKSPESLPAGRQGRNHFPIQKQSSHKANNHENFSLSASMTIRPGSHHNRSCKNLPAISFL